MSLGLVLLTLASAHAVGDAVDAIAFPSGFRVSVDTPVRVPLVGLRLVVEAGSSYDPPGAEGAAHLIEHLAFERRLDDGLTVDERATRLGCRTNAETTWDHVAFELACPRTALPDALALLGAVLDDPLRGVDDATLARERGVVVREAELHEHEGALGWLSPALAALDPQGPYARPIGGTPTSTPSLGLDALRTLVAERYRPELASLTVTGASGGYAAISRAFEALPARAFLPGATTLRLERFPLADGTVDLWPTEGPDSAAPLAVGRPMVVATDPWRPVPPAATRPLELTLPALDPRRGAVPGMVAVLRPIDEIRAGFTFGALAGVVEHEVWNVFDDRAIRGWAVRCAATGLARASLLWCWAEPSPELGVQPTAADRVAELLVEAVRIASRGPNAIAGTGLGLGFLGRTWARGEDLRELAGDRLVRLSTLLHAGYGDDALHRYLGLQALGRASGENARRLLARADAVAVPVTWSPAPARWVGLGAAATRAPGRSVGGRPLVQAPPLAAPEDVRVETLRNGLTVVALRWDRATPVAAWYGRLPTTAPPVVDHALQDALDSAVARQRRGRSDGAWPMSDEVVLAGDAIAVLRMLHTDVPTLVRGMAAHVRGLGEGPTASPLADAVRRLTAEGRAWRSVRRAALPHERRWFAAGIARVEEEVEVRRVLYAALGIASGSTAGLSDVDLDELAALDPEACRRVLGAAFGPAASVVVLVGPFDPEAALATARAELSDLSASALTTSAPYVSPPRPPSPRTAILWDETSRNGLAEVETWCAVPGGGPVADTAARVVSLGAQEAMTRAFRIEADLAYDPFALGGGQADHVRLGVGATVSVAEVPRALGLQAAVLDDVAAPRWAERHADVAARFAFTELLRADTTEHVADVVGERVLRGVPPARVTDLVGAGVPTTTEIAELGQRCAERRVVLVRGDAAALRGPVEAALPGWTVTVVSVPVEAVDRRAARR